MMTKLNITFRNDSAITRMEHDIDAMDLCSIAEAEIKSADYQRLSQYRIGDNETTCDVVALGKEIDPSENELSFENDEEIIGKWEIIAVYVVKQKFYDNLFCVKNFYGGEQKYL